MLRAMRKMSHGVLAVASVLLLETMLFANLGCATSVFSHRFDLSDEYREGIVQLLVSPDTGDLLVVYRKGRYQHLYLLPPDASRCELLTAGEEFCFHPAFSADGSALVYASARGRRRCQSDLLVIDLQERSQRRIVQDLGLCSHPSFSSDGRTVVFAAYLHGRQADIYVVSRDGDGVKAPGETSTHEDYPVFVQGGARIAFWRAEWYGHSSPIGASTWHLWNLYLLGEQGEGDQRLTKSPLYNIEWHSLTRDGSKMVYVDCVDNLWEVDFGSEKGSQTPRQVIPKGEAYTQVIEGKERVEPFFYPAFSPDATQLAFVKLLEPSEEVYSYPRTELHLLNLTSQEVIQLTKMGTRIEQPVFSPDGQQILFVVYRRLVGGAPVFQELWRVDIQGANLERLATEDVLHDAA